MASSPTYSPLVHVPPYRGSRAVFKSTLTPSYDKAFQGTYPAGSTFKPMTATAAFESGVLAPGQNARLPRVLHVALRPVRAGPEDGVQRLDAALHGADGPRPRRSRCPATRSSTSSATSSGRRAPSSRAGSASSATARRRRSTPAAPRPASCPTTCGRRSRTGRARRASRPSRAAGCRATTSTCRSARATCSSRRCSRRSPTARSRTAATSSRRTSARRSSQPGSSTQPIPGGVIDPRPVRHLNLSPTLLTEIKLGLYGATHAGDGTSTVDLRPLLADRVRQDRHRRGADHHVPELLRRLVGGLGVAGRPSARRGRVHPQRRPRRRVGRAGGGEHVPGVLRTAQPLRHPRRAGPVAMTHYLRHLDYLMLATALSISAFGLWIMQTATQELRGQPVRPPAALRRGRHRRACSSIAAVPPAFMRRVRWPLYAFVLLSTAAVLAVGTSVGGGRRWINLGAFQFQPSEFAKLLLDRRPRRGAGRAARRHRPRPADAARDRLHGRCRPLLVFKEPDFGTTLVFLAIMLGMLFVYGIPWQHFVWMAIAVVRASWRSCSRSCPAWACRWCTGTSSRA